MLKHFGFDPACFDIEFDETAISQDTEPLMAFVAPLQAGGVRITFAGFGGETNRLQWLKSLKIRSLRINRTFAR